MDYINKPHFLCGHVQEWKEGKMGFREVGVKCSAKSLSLFIIIINECMWILPYMFYIIFSQGIKPLE